jgi:hypothetical protein
MPPANYDLRRGIGNRIWQWLGNDRFGDCTVAAYLHLCMVHNIAASSSWKKLLYRAGYRPPHDPFAVVLYTEFLATLNEKPSGTQGVDPFTFFTWLKVKGIIQDFQQIDITAPGEDAMHQAMIDWSGCLLALNLTTYAFDTALNGKAWDVRPGDVPAFGHAVALVEYGPLNDAVVTWGQIQSMTRAFTKECVYACWVFK